MPRYALVIFLGTLAGYYQNHLPDVYWSAWVPVLLYLAWTNPRYRLFLVLIATWLWSSGILQFHLDHRLIESFDGRNLRVAGRIADLVEVQDRRIRFELEPEWIEGYPGRLPRRLRVSWYQTDRVPKAGEHWQFELKLRRPGGYLNPGGFDYQAWQFSRGFDGTAYVRPSKTNRRIATAPPYDLHRWRSQLAEAIEQACNDCAHRGLIQALVLGFRGNIDPGHRQILRASGTAHLLAISGLHIGLVAGMFFLAGRLCWRLGFGRSSCARQQLASLAALSGAFCYAALAGFSLPTVRALIMLAVMLLAFLCRQRPNLANSIALAVMTVLVFDPRAIGSVSLWLSLTALLIIACAQLRLVHVRGWWWQLITLQLYFSVFMLPLGLFLFGQATPAGFAANLVAIPVVSFIVLPLSVLASLLALADVYIAGLLLWVLDHLIGGLLTFLQWLLDSGLDAYIGLSVPAPLLFGLVAVLLLWAVPVSAAMRRAGILLAAVLISWQPSRPQPGEFRLDVLDVGMGTSIVVQTRWHSLIYDFGPGNRAGFSAADWTLIPFLRSRRIASPDLMVVSHVDQDHSGGFSSFAGGSNRVPLLSGTVDELEARFALNKRIDSCHSAPAWTWDGVDFQFLYSAVTAGAECTNNRSCVLMIQGYHRALLPGDIEIEQEKRLVDEWSDALNTDILVAPHHGSNTSSGNAFLDRTTPDYVVFTVSRNNRWGFPHREVKRRYEAHGSRIFRSDRHGAVSFVSRANRLEWLTTREPPRRIWRRW